MFILLLLLLLIIIIMMMMILIIILTIIITAITHIMILNAEGSRTGTRAVSSSAHKRRDSNPPELGQIAPRHGSAA